MQTLFSSRRRARSIGPEHQPAFLVPNPRPAILKLPLCARSPRLSAFDTLAEQTTIGRPPKAERCKTSTAEGIARTAWVRKRAKTASQAARSLVASGCRTRAKRQSNLAALSGAAAYAYARANTRTGQELERVFGQQSTGTAGCSCEAAAAAGSVDKAPRVADRRESELLRERLSH